MAEYGFLMDAVEGKPTSLGCDVAGTIVAASPSSSLQVGQRVVTYLGADKTQSGTTRPAFADTTAADADVVFPIPEGLTFAQAASIPVGALTATLLLDAVAPTLKKDAWVLVWGASSSVGFNAVQLATHRGYKVLAVASAKHAPTLTKMGAAVVVDYKDDDATMTEHVKANINGTPINAALDCIGSDDSFARSAALLVAWGTAETRILSTVNGGLPEPPKGITKVPVSLASLDDNRPMIVQAMPTILKVCKPQKLRTIQGEVSAETVEQAFAVQKKGVSGEKVVIEWKKE
jgi:NADPH:quinone reductase-like Zn-dependent oxidoreductase